MILLPSDRRFIRVGITEQVCNVDAVVVPLGDGLIAGMATAAKNLSLQPKTTV